MRRATAADSITRTRRGDMPYQFRWKRQIARGSLNTSRFLLGLLAVQVACAALVFMALAPGMPWAQPAPGNVTLGGWHGWDNLRGHLDLSLGPECVSRKAGVIDCFASATVQNSPQVTRFGSESGFAPGLFVPGISPVVFNSDVNATFDNQRPSCVSFNPQRID